MQTEWIKKISEKLEDILTQTVSDSELREQLKYSLLPPGKLFRPLLVHHLALDLNSLNGDHLLFSCSLEIHHCYTLIHDDLPAMDDDDQRRGKPSAHKKYSEWEAILSGDSLLGLSYQILGDLKSKELASLIKLYGERTAGNGLILGQRLDMKASAKSLEDILRIHELKTSRLMQLALEGSAIIAEKPKLLEDMSLLGLRLGQSFQLLDDLCELTAEVQGHELKANPFLNHSPEALIAILSDFHREMFDICDKHQLHSLKSFIESYEAKIAQKLNGASDILSSKIKIDTESWSFLGS